MIDDSFQRDQRASLFLGKKYRVMASLFSLNQ